MLVPVLLLLLVLALLLIESVLVRRRVNRLSVRIHVNGTRGKSSVTRYIAAAMRANGRRTVAKVTGVTPTFIGPDGGLQTITRRGGARVQEQFKIVGRAARHNAECLVLECMSIRPELQALESRFYRPHVYVLTNVKDDHQEALGGDPAEQIRALCDAVPHNCAIVTTNGDHLTVLRATAAKRGSKVIVVSEKSHDGFAENPPGVFTDNIAMALSAAVLSGADSKTAIQAIIKEAFNSTAARAARIPVDSFAFVDGFTVNDVPSADTFLSYWRSVHPEKSKLAVIFNARADRPLRSVAFSRYLPTVAGLDRIILVGSHAPFMHRALKSAGFESNRIRRWSRSDIATAPVKLAAEGITPKYLVAGLGNIGGDGFLVSAAITGETTHAV